MLFQCLHDQLRQGFTCLVGECFRFMNEAIIDLNGYLHVLLPSCEFTSCVVWSVDCTGDSGNTPISWRERINRALQDLICPPFRFTGHPLEVLQVPSGSFGWLFGAISRFRYGAEPELLNELVVGELLECDDCGRVLEITGLGIVTVWEAPEAEEDRGELSTPRYSAMSHHSVFFLHSLVREDEKLLPFFALNTLQGQSWS